MKEPTQHKTKAKKIFLGVLVVLFLLAVLASIDSSDDQPATNSPQAQAAPIKQEAPAAPKTWQKVVELSGSSNKRSDVFHLQGGQQRITYLVDGQYATVYFYFMPAGKTLDKDGGFPEVAAATNGDTMSYRDAGEYYFDVSGTGNWTIQIEELRS